MPSISSDIRNEVKTQPIVLARRSAKVWYGESMPNTGRYIMNPACSILPGSSVLRVRREMIGLLRSRARSMAVRKMAEV